MENNLFQTLNFLPFDILGSFSDIFNSQTGFLPVDSDEQEKPKVRGRKKLRPGNPLKTEVLDKYWLRAFKNYAKSCYFELRSICTDREFWSWYISKGKPGKNGEFLSYNSNYKQRLFSNPSFCAGFAAWAICLGWCLKPKKSLKVPWEYYFNYLFQELIPNALSQGNMEDFRRCHQYIYQKVCLSTVKIEIINTEI